MSYEPKSYWEKRLKENFSVRHTGHVGFNLVYNTWSYKVKVRILEETLNCLKIDCDGKSVLDIGCGTGFWIEFYKSKGATPIVGVDISSISIERLKGEYPQLEFFELDIGEADINIDRRFDIVNVFDVLYHIKDRWKFSNAISNVAHLSNVGSHIFITDALIDKSESEHVFFRSLTTYEEEFKRNSLRLIEVIPLYYLLNRQYPFLLKAIKFALLKINVNIDDVMAPILYGLDKVFLSLNRSHLKLVICAKE
jgi:SAM-dependent methyltransferase